MPLTEYGLQQQMVKWFEEEGLSSDSPPVVAVGANAGNPHYLPTAERSSADRRRPGTAARPVGQIRDAWRCLCRYHLGGLHGRVRCRRARRRRSALWPPRETPRSRWSKTRPRERDAISAGGRWTGRRRAVLEEAGFGDRILHRTGHSLGEQVHGNGVHLDDYETHDDRRLLPGAGFTIEPGLYFETFGVRTEINMFRGGT